MACVPTFVTSASTMPDHARNDPLAIETVACTFPPGQLSRAGCYPNLNVKIGLAFRNENVFVSPDICFWAPGGRCDAEAGTEFLRNQLLFGSSFPFRPMR